MAGSFFFSFFLCQAIDQMATDDEATKAASLGADFLLNDDVNSALQQFGRAIALDRGVASYYVRRSICHFKLSNFTEALEDANAALRIDPSDSMAHFRKG